MTRKFLEAHHLSQGVITFTAEQLKGVPQDVISGYTKRTEGSQEVYDVTYKTPDIFPIVSLFVFLPHSTLREKNYLSSNLRKTQKHARKLRKVTNLD